jgi:hypothetical protein
LLERRIRGSEGCGRSGSGALSVGGENWQGAK